MTLRMLRLQHGFTLTELMITLAVAIILTTIAAPSFREIIQNNRLVTQANDFVTALSMARSEASKRGVQVTVCESSGGASCDGANWEDGWIVFVDNDGGGTVDAGDSVFRVYPKISGGNTMREKNNAVNLTYRPTGESNTFGTFTFCDSRGASKAQAVIVSQTGRPRTSTTAADGTSLSCP